MILIYLKMTESNCFVKKQKPSATGLFSCADRNNCSSSQSGPSETAAASYSPVSQLWNETDLFSNFMQLILVKENTDVKKICGNLVLIVCTTTYTMFFLLALQKFWCFPLSYCQLQKMCTYLACLYVDNKKTRLKHIIYCFRLNLLFMSCQIQHLHRFRTSER